MSPRQTAVAAAISEDEREAAPADPLAQGQPLAFHRY
jgi:hypothetical protein